MGAAASAHHITGPRKGRGRGHGARCGPAQKRGLRTKITEENADEEYDADQLAAMDGDAPEEKMRRAETPVREQLKVLVLEEDERPEEQEEGEEPAPAPALIHSKRVVEDDEEGAAAQQGRSYPVPKRSQKAEAYVPDSRFIGSSADHHPWPAPASPERKQAPAADTSGDRLYAQRLQMQEEAMARMDELRGGMEHIARGADILRALGPAQLNHFAAAFANPEQAAYVQFVIRNSMIAAHGAFAAEHATLARKVRQLELVLNGGK